MWDKNHRMRQGCNYLQSTVDIESTYRHIKHLNCSDFAIIILEWARGVIIFAKECRRWGQLIALLIVTMWQLSARGIADKKNNQHTATTFILYWPFLMKIISIINIHMVAMANFKPMCVCSVRDGLIIMHPYLYCLHTSIFY